MTRQQINPTSVVRSLDHGFPQAVVTAGKKRLYVSGQTAWDVYKPENAEAVGSTFREFFASDAAPATTWVGVAALADPAFLVEVEATAVFG